MKPSLRTLRCLLLSFTFWSCGSAGGGSGNPSDATPSDAGSPDAAVGLDAGLGAGWTQEVFCRKPAELTVPASAGRVYAPLAEQMRFLYSGPSPVQVGAHLDRVPADQLALVRGLLCDPARGGLDGVRVAVLGHPELGSTRTREGQFDLVVLGGAPLVLRFEKPGLMPAQRRVTVAAGAMTWVDDVVLLPAGPRIHVALDGTEQLIEGSPSRDAEGGRQARLLLRAGTQAHDNSLQKRALTGLSLRPTEFTVGAAGPFAMPGELPATSAYTYALSVAADGPDGGVDAGADAGADAGPASPGGAPVEFDPPLVLYLENFLDFPVGGDVPVGTYDEALGSWASGENGRIIGVVGEHDGVADVDLDGDGQADDPDTLSAFGMGDEERGRLAGLYNPGQSVWRVPVASTQSIDCNWPFGFPPGARGPHLRGGGQGTRTPCQRAGSIVGCQDQSLGERIPLAGTPQALSYQSSRMPGFGASRILDLPVGGTDLPGSLKRIEVEILIAGQRHRQQLAPSAGAAIHFVWDGLDAWGRPVEGPSPAQVRVGYVYDGVYELPASSPSAFGLVSGVPLAGAKTRQELIHWQSLTTQLGDRPIDTACLGGVSLSDHSVYDARSQTLYLGDGRTRDASLLGYGGTVFTVASHDGPRRLDDLAAGERVPASQLKFGDLTGMAVDPLGRVVVSQADRVYRLGTDALVERIAGGGPAGSGDAPADGVPGLEIELGWPSHIATGPDASVYLTESNSGRVQRIAPDGRVFTVAGGGALPPDATSAGQPARELELDFSDMSGGLAVGPDGTLYLNSGGTAIVRVDPGGMASLVAGGGEDPPDGIPGTQAVVDDVIGLALGPDGSLYLAAGFIYDPKVLRLGPDGLIERFAGRVEPDDADDPLVSGDWGDDGPATEGRFKSIQSVAVGVDGSVYVGDFEADRVRRITPDGTIHTLMGQVPIDWSEPFPEGGSSVRAPVPLPGDLSVGPEGSLYVRSFLGVLRVDFGHGRLGRNEYLVPGDPPEEILVFEPSGHLLRALDTLTGALRREFHYDAAGCLSDEVDASGATLHVERDAEGKATAVVAPGGQRTLLQVDGDGRLTQVQDPLGRKTTLGYGPNGLLATFVDPAGGEHAFSYDETGRLVQDTQPDGTSLSLARTETPDGFSVQATSPAGQVGVYAVERLPDGTQRRTYEGPGGARTELLIQPDGTRQLTRPDGLVVLSTLAPDPRWQMQVPYAARSEVRLPSGLTLKVTAERSAELSDPEDPFSVVTLRETWTTNDDATWVTTFDGATRNVSLRSPEGVVRSIELDPSGRPVSLAQAADLAPTTLTWAGSGLLEGLAWGDQRLELHYDAAREVDTATDAAGATLTLAHDAAGQRTQATMPSGGLYPLGHDAMGHLNRVGLPPDRTATLTWGESPPSLAFTPPGGEAEQWAYDNDGRLVRRTLASGRVFEVTRDAQGRWTGSTTPEGHVAVAYARPEATQPQEVRWQALDGAEQVLRPTWDGPLLTGMGLEGPAQGSTTADYDERLLLRQFAVDSPAGAETRALTRDADGRLTGEGDVALSRGGPGHGLSRLAGAGLTVDYGQDEMGRLTHRSHQMAGREVYSLDLAYDTQGHVRTRTESVDGQTTSQDYVYDADGQLVEVQRGGALAERYAWDAGGNRTLRQAPGGPDEAGTYDAQDRLLEYAGEPWQVDADGQVVEGAGLTLQVSARGELLEAVVGDQTVRYTSDGLGRRVARQVGDQRWQYFYANPQRAFELTHVVGPDGQLVALYYDDWGALVLLRRGADSWAVACDQAGTPRLVVDAAGQVVKRVEHDAFGRIVEDTAPSFELPLGFAGGLADPLTGLVHLGLRDLDPRTGRFTTRDPLLFAGGQTNLYVYARNDPVGLRDPLGLACVSVGFSAYDGLGGGVTLHFGNGGVALTIEAGVGFGGGVSVGFSPFADVPEAGTSLIGKVSVGPASLGFSINECAQAKVEVGVGPVSVDPLHPIESLSGESDPSEWGGGRPEPSEGGGTKVEAKIAIQHTISLF